jgi:hypothetical protein
MKWRLIHSINIFAVETHHHREQWKKKKSWNFNS